MARRSPKGEKAREKITRAATRVFGGRGFDLATVQEIADLAEMNKAAVLHHFDGKLALFQSSVESALGVFAEVYASRIKPEDPPWDSLRKIFEANLRAADESPDDISVMVLLYSLAIHQPEIRKIETRILSEIHDRYVRIIESGIREKTFRPEIPSREVAQALHEAVVGGMILHMSGERTAADAKRLQRKWESLARGLLRVA